MLLTPSEIENFREVIWEYFGAHERSMPWRDQPAPYYVMVSELMLQQTQVSRVIPKFNAFVAEFPDVIALAAAPLARVLQAWNGLGYNRRAKFLHLAAQSVMQNGGVIPSNFSELLKLPGIGPNTAGAIMNYAYNQPTVFVETNIRTIYLHHFFADTSETVDDAALKSLVEQTLDHDHPREWFWALMDYGAHLKKTTGGKLNQSSRYKKQSPLAGSLREMRGRIIKQLATTSHDELALRELVDADERFVIAIAALQQEGMIVRVGAKWCLTGNEQAS